MVQWQVFYMYRILWVMKSALRGLKAKIHVLQDNGLQDFSCLKSVTFDLSPEQEADTN